MRTSPYGDRMKRFHHTGKLAGHWAAIDRHGDSGSAADGRYDLDVHIADVKAILQALPSRAFIVAAGLGAIIALAVVGESLPHLVSGLAIIDANDEVGIL